MATKKCKKINNLIMKASEGSSYKNRKYGLNTLNRAIEFLAIHEGSAKVRLKECYYVFTFVMIGRGDFPERFLTRWLSIRSKFTKKPATQFSTSINQTFRLMKNKTASKLIEEMIELKDDLESYFEIRD